MKKMMMRSKERKRRKGTVMALIPYDRNSHKLSDAQLGREELNIYNKKLQNIPLDKYKINTTS